MYKIDSMYEGMADALTEAVGQGKTTRWMAATAWWLGRQQIANAANYWLTMAARITADLNDADRESILVQLSKAEDAMVENAGAIPEMPSSVSQWMANWVPEVVEVDLDKLRSGAVAKVDRAAEVYRLNFITAGDGQVMAYQQKLAEAEAYIENTSIDETEIPHIVREAAMDTVSLADKATEIVSVFRAWKAVSAGIEAKRLGAKKVIHAATIKAEIDAAMAINWSAE